MVTRYDWYIREYKEILHGFGRFFVIRDVVAKWVYLLSDGTESTSTQDQNRITKGWYKTEKEARQAIDKWEKIHFYLKPNTMGDIPVTEAIVYDPAQREYYNTKTDIFLCNDDILYHKLRPYTHITTPLPAPLKKDYFTNF